MNRHLKPQWIHACVAALFLTSCGPSEQRFRFEPIAVPTKIDLFSIPDGVQPKVDKVFVINLDRDTDRLKRTKERFGAHGLEFERFPAVYGKSLSQNERERVYHYDPQYLKRGLADGEIGNYLSHFGIMEKVVKERYEVTAVFEDDVILHPDRFTRRLESLLAHAPEGWDIIYLGCHATEGSPVKDRTGYGSKTGEVIDCSPSRMTHVAEGRLVKMDTKCLAGNYAYVVSLEGAKKLAKFMLPMSMPTDYAFKDRFVSGDFGPFSAYCANPELVFADYSVENTINPKGQHRSETPPPQS